MNTKIDDAIKTLTEKAKYAKTADEALKLTQAALNLAHTASVIKANAS